MSLVSGVTRHAAATTGPASAAMPTSSTPTTRRSPCDHSRFSWLREGIVTSVGDGGRGAEPPDVGAEPPTSAALFAQGGRFAHTLAEEIERGAPGVAVTDELDLLDAWRVHEERPLDADPARDPSHRDLLVEPAVADSQDRPLEVLNTLPVPFDDAHAHAHGVSGPDLGEIRLRLLGGKRVQQVVHRHGDGAHGVDR